MKQKYLEAFERFYNSFLYPRNTKYLYFRVDWEQTFRTMDDLHDGELVYLYCDTVLTHPPKDMRNYAVFRASCTQDFSNCLDSLWIPPRGKYKKGDDAYIDFCVHFNNSRGTVLDFDAYISANVIHIPKPPKRTKPSNKENRHEDNAKAEY